MFGIGMTELLIILVLATIVVGPEKMVEFAGQLGRWVAKFRAETGDITREFRDAFDLELGEFKNELNEVKHDIEDLKDVTDTLNAPLDTSQTATRGRPNYTMPTRQGQQSYNLPTSAQPTADAATPTAAGAAAAAATAAGTAAPTAAPAGPSEAEPVQIAPEPETVRDLSPDAEAVEISVGVMVGEDVEAEPMVLDGPVLIEDPSFDEQPEPQPESAGGSAERSEDATEEE
jgi:sec-independent protein translocase protein TatB